MMEVCEKCGGNLYPEGCRLCPMFAEGQVLTPNASSCWPMNMGDSLGCHPKQVEKAQARAKKHGVNVVYQKNGDVIVPDRNERRKLLKLEGMVDRNSFTGY